VTSSFLRPHAVKSISQYGLLMYWARVAQLRPFPSIGEFRPDARLHDPKQLLFWKVEEADSERIFRALGHGRYITESYHSSIIGRSMSDLAPANMREFALETANQCANSGRPVYSVIATQDVDGRRVDCERLLLPFGVGGHVDQVLVSLQLISAEGRFTRATIYQRFCSKAEVLLSGLLQIDEPAKEDVTGSA
jgi:hypothetical protein